MTKPHPYDGEGTYSNYLHVTMVNKLEPPKRAALEEAIKLVYKNIDLGRDPCTPAEPVFSFHPWVQITP